MHSLARNRPGWFCLSLTAFVLGCSSHKEVETKSKTDSATTDSTTTPAPGPEKPFQLGNQIEKFDPPSLADLDKAVQWVDRPVYSGLDELRKAQEAAGPAPLSVKDALALRNNFPAASDANEKIIKTLGRVAPAEGASVNFDETWIRHA